MIKNNVDLRVDNSADYLAGKKIGLCVTGGIAAIETPKIARQLRRYGANVTVYTTPAAFNFVGKTALEWGSENSVVSELSGGAEHICLEDLVLVAPATLNTVNKVFCGIADNPVTTLIASALGMKRPVYLAPTMHESLYSNPIFQRNLSFVKELGMSVITPRFSEGKAKIASQEYICAEVSRALSKHGIKGKKILITGGPTPGKLDDVRVITNIFTGKLAVEIAKEAYHLGADVTLLLGKTGLVPPDYLNVIFHSDYGQYRQNVFSSLGDGYDAGIFSAAVADYIPAEVHSGKIPSGGVISSIPLKQTEKVIKLVREKYPELFMVTFKYESDKKTHDELIETAQSRVRDQHYQLVVANRGSDMKTGHRAYIVSAQGIISEPGSKKEISKELIKYVGIGLTGGELGWQGLKNRFMLEEPLTDREGDILG